MVTVSSVRRQQSSSSIEQQQQQAISPQWRRLARDTRGEPPVVEKALIPVPRTHTVLYPSIPPQALRVQPGYWLYPFTRAATQLIDRPPVAFVAVRRAVIACVQAHRRVPTEMMLPMQLYHLFVEFGCIGPVFYLSWEAYRGCRITISSFKPTSEVLERTIFFVYGQQPPR